MKELKKSLRLSLVIVLTLLLVLIPSTVNAQSIENSYDEGGPSGTPLAGEESGSSSTTLFVVFGVAVAALLFYNFVLKKDKKPDKGTESDSTSTASTLNFGKNLSAGEELKAEIQKMQNKLPVHLFLGIDRDKYLISRKKISVGLSVKF